MLDSHTAEKNMKKCKTKMIPKLMKEIKAKYYFISTFTSYYIRICNTMLLFWSNYRPFLSSNSIISIIIKKLSFWRLP
jgi:hypothetical protein